MGRSGTLEWAVDVAVGGDNAWSGTHQGEFNAIPATGKQVNWTATVTFRIADGIIREALYNMDVWGLMQQLDVVPTPGQSGS